MSKYEPNYSKGDKIENNNTNQIFIIQEMEYDKALCDIVYKVQHCRMKFNMRKVPESVIVSNIESGEYKLLTQ